MKRPNYTVADYLQLKLNEFNRTLRSGIVVAFMFTTVAAVATPVDGYQSSLQPETQIVMTLPNVEPEAHNEVIENLSALEVNWDGEGAVAPNEQALENSRKLLSLLKPEHLQYLSPSDMYASSYGSVVMDFETPRGLVSVEVGDETMGFYTDFPDSPNYATEGIRTDFNVAPQILINYLS